jgi:hypothetical protein
MARGAGFVFFVVTADGATLAKAKVQPMPGSKRDSCAGGKKVMGDLNRPGMGMIVTMSMGIRPKKKKDQSKPESKRHPESSMLQVTAKQSGTGN